MTRPRLGFLWRRCSISGDRTVDERNPPICSTCRRLLARGVSPDVLEQATGPELLDLLDAAELAERLGVDGLV